ncbi:hypothetical protein [Microcoleus sp. B4-D4]|uniref:hypothetical protein n=1 Tax=Microcoleus sp. B4-D4 TaxID=2818667 RepID=UPI002FCF26AB
MKERGLDSACFGYVIRISRSEGKDGKMGGRGDGESLIDNLREKCLRNAGQLTDSRFPIPDSLICKGLKSLPGLYLCSNYLGGVALGDCVRRGFERAQEVGEYLQQSD